MTQRLDDGRRFRLDRGPGRACDRRLPEAERILSQPQGGPMGGDRPSAPHPRGNQSAGRLPDSGTGNQPAEPVLSIAAAVVTSTRSTSTAPMATKPYQSRWANWGG